MTQGAETDPKRGNSTPSVSVPRIDSVISTFNWSLYWKSSAYQLHVTHRRVPPYSRPRQLQTVRSDGITTYHDTGVLKPMSSDRSQHSYSHNVVVASCLLRIIVRELPQCDVRTRQIASISNIQKLDIIALCYSALKPASACQCSGSADSSGSFFVEAHTVDGLHPRTVDVSHKQSSCFHCFFNMLLSPLASD